jgi:hypothetical protein
MGTRELLWRIYFSFGITWYCLIFQTCAYFSLIPERRKREEKPQILKFVQLQLLAFFLSFLSCSHFPYGQYHILLEQEGIKEDNRVSFCSEVHIFWGLLLFVLVFYLFNVPTFRNINF